MNDNENNAEKWKKAQRSEFQFYSDIKKKVKFSKDFRYAHGAWDYKFEHWGFKNFDNRAILEVGSNVFGPLHYINAEKTFKVGIDPLLGTLYNEVATKDISYIRSVGEHLPFTGEKFDVVLCHNVLDHVKNPKRVLEEIHRVLRKQGVFLLCVNTHPSFIRALGPFLDGLDERHPYHFTPHQVQFMVKSLGFNIIRFKVIRGHDTPEPKCHYLRRMLKALRFKPFLAFFVVNMVYITATKTTEQRNIS